jgi:hypothetical protein
MISVIEEGKEIVSLDESSFNSNISVKQGWIINKSSRIKTYLKKFNSITLIGAIQFNGVSIILSFWETKIDLLL